MDIKISITQFKLFSVENIANDSYIVKFNFTKFVFTDIDNSRDQGSTLTSIAHP
jgi:hypothetical protein